MPEHAVWTEHISNLLNKQHAAYRSDFEAVCILFQALPDEFLASLKHGRFLIEAKKAVAGTVVNQDRQDMEVDSEPEAEAAPEEAPSEIKQLQQDKEAASTQAKELIDLATEDGGDMAGKEMKKEILEVQSAGRWKAAVAEPSSEGSANADGGNMMSRDQHSDKVPKYKVPFVIRKVFVFVFVCYPQGEGP